MAVLKCFSVGGLASFKSPTSVLRKAERRKAEKPKSRKAEKLLPCLEAETLPTVISESSQCSTILAHWGEGVGGGSTNLNTNACYCPTVLLCGSLS